MTPSKNTVCLWYDNDAEEAARFYATTFADSAVGAIHRAPGDYPAGKAGDVLVGIASSGVHSNGFSLVRKIVADNCFDLHEVYPELSNKLLGEVLLTPTKIYVRQVLEVIRNCDVHGISHITGGGFDENIPRILHEGQGLEIDEGSWEILPVFRFLEKYGKVAHREMFNIFNMGIGMVIALDASQAGKAIAILAEQGEKAAVIGRVTDTEGVVIR